MSKNTSDRKRMPGEDEDRQRNAQHGQEGQQGKKKGGQEQQNQQGEPRGQKPDRQPGQEKTRQGPAHRQEGEKYTSDEDIGNKRHSA
jgi:hypothetical protein